LIEHSERSGGMVENRNGSKRPSGIVRNDVPSLFSFRLPDSSFFFTGYNFLHVRDSNAIFLRYTAPGVMLVIFFLPLKQNLRATKERRLFLVKY